MVSRSSFPEEKGPGREANHSPPSSVEVKERLELYLYSLNTSSWHGAQLKVEAQGQLYTCRKTVLEYNYRCCVLTVRCVFFPQSV